MATFLSGLLIPVIVFSVGPVPAPMNGRAIAVVLIGGSDGPTNLAPTHFTSVVMAPATALATLCGVFGVAKWRAARQFASQHDPEP